MWRSQSVKVHLKYILLLGQQSNLVACIYSSNLFWYQQKYTKQLSRLAIKLFHENSNFNIDSVQIK